MNGKSLNRRAMFGSLTVAVATVAIGGLAWACVAIAPGPTFTTSATQVPVGAATTVTASAWKADSPVAIGLSPDGTRITQALASVTPAVDGSFTTEVPLTATNSGVMYLVLSQDDSRKAVPVELTAPLNAVGTQIAAPSAASAADDLWGGFATAPTPVPGLDGLQAEPAAGSGVGMWTMALVAGVGLAGAGSVVYGLRRRQVAVNH